MLKAVVTIFWVHLASFAYAQTPREPVDRAVALVDNAVVTASDLNVHIALGATDKSFVPVLKAAPETVLDDAIHATIIQAMAGRLSAYQPNPAQVRTRISEYRNRWVSEQDWQRHLMILGLNEKGIMRAFERRLVIERVVSRAIGKPEEGQEAEWTENFRSWLARERQRVRVRIVAPTSDTPKP